MDGCSSAISGHGFVWLMLTEPQVCLLHLPEQAEGDFPGWWDIASSVGQREGVRKESGVSVRWNRQGALASSSVFRCICLQLPEIVF